MVDSGHFLIFCFLVELAMFFGMGLLFSLAVEELNSSKYSTDNAEAGAAALLMFVIFSIVALVFLFRGEL